GALRRTLATTNPIESALSVTRRVTARVTRWRDGEMRRRWCVAGLLRAESKFRRVKGHRALPTLIKALEESARARRSGIERGGAWDGPEEPLPLMTTGGTGVARGRRGRRRRGHPGRRVGRPGSWPCRGSRPGRRRRGRPGRPARSEARAVR